MTRPIRIERRRPDCIYARGQKVRVDVHSSQPGVNFSGLCGVVTFSTAILIQQFIDFEQVTIALRNGPSVILKVGGRYGVDKIRIWVFCDKCGKKEMHCVCNDTDDCHNCTYQRWDCRCCGDCGGYGDNCGCEPGP